MIKNIIFDLGNVILKQETLTVRDYFWKIFKTDRAQSDEFILGFKRKVDTGLMKFDELYSLYRERFNTSMSYEEFIDRYKKSYLADVAGIDQEMIGMIKKLYDNNNLFLMTNTVAPHYESLNEKEFSPYFRRIFRSDTDHFVKPEREAYEYVLKEIGAKGDECVFVDDLESNVKGATAVGINGVVFKNPSQLVVDLKKIGVMI